MIIKSMARKDPSFGQLIEYMSDIDKSDEQYNVYQNLYSRKPDDIEAEFLRNAQLMRKRKNGNYLYHEVLSITKAQKLEHEKQKQILRSIAYEYAKNRAESNLIFGTLHDDHDDHLHYHLLISANALNEPTKTRLSKAQFDKLKKQMEARVLKHHPELEQKVVINQEAEEKLSKKGAERKRRTGETPQRDKLKEKLQDIFSRCKTKEDFFSALNEASLEFYVRGKTMGVKDLANDRNHRLKTLGLLDDFESLSDRIELDEQQEQKKQSQERTNTEPQLSEKTKHEKTEDRLDDKKTHDKQESKTSREQKQEYDPVEKQRAKHKEETENIRKQQQESQDNDEQEDKDGRKP